LLSRIPQYRPGVDRTPPSAEERLERIAAAQGLLADAGRSLGPAIDLETTVSTVLQVMRKLVTFRGGSICLVEHDLVRVAASDPPVSEEVLALRLPVGSGIVGRAVAEKATLYSPDLDRDERVDPEVRRLGSNAGMVSYLAVPLVCLGRTVGVLQVDSADRDAFDDIDVMLLEGLAAQTANAIESARYIEEMTRLDALKHGFINLVSHELRTPLTIAAGMLHMYRELNEAPTTPELEDMLDRSESAMARLRRLIEELIVMSQLAAGDLTVAHDPVRICDLVTEVVNTLPDPSGVTIDCQPDLVLVTDGRLLSRILEALVENAVTYAGSAEVVAGAGAIEVRDQGPGLPADVLDREGETFARSVRNPTTVAGLGLGLSMARALVSELDGELRIDTSPAGTTVRIELPEPVSPG
jgi:signal transduction histidine kinase